MNFCPYWIFDRFLKGGLNYYLSHFDMVSYYRLKEMRETIIKLYNTLALPVLLYGSETWTVKARDARRITAAEMKYVRRTVGYTWTDYKTNT